MTTVPLPPATLAIDAIKIDRYLLDLAHPIGRAKAIFFIRRFLALASGRVGACLFEQADPDNLSGTMQTPFGTKWIFEGPILAPNGDHPGIRTVWIDRHDQRYVADLCTAYRFA